MLLYLPYRFPAGTPLASRPQRFSLAIDLHFVQHLLVTLLPNLVIHHFVHPRYSLLFGGSISRALCPCAHSTTPPPVAALNSVTYASSHPTPW